MRRSVVLDLRPVVPSDLPIFFEQQRDPVACAMAAFTAPDPSDEAAFLAHWSKLLATPEISVRAVLHRGAVVGHVASFPRLKRRELGYWIGRPYWGQGLASGAVTAFLPLVPIRPLYARVAHDNAASIRVLEKCGFRPLAVERAFAPARGAEIDEVLYLLARAAPTQGASRRPGP